MRQNDNSDFYRKYNFLPTLTKISSNTPDLLRQYCSSRAYLFEKCLKFPITGLQNIEYLEIGPDSGENALVAAIFGARISVIDKNPRAIEVCSQKFEELHLKDRLISAEVVGLEDYTTDRVFGFVAAEGFVHSMADKKGAFANLRNLVSPNGFLLLSFYEKYSCFADLLHSRLFKEIVKLKFGREWSQLAIEHVVDYGQELFEPKWNLKSHSRSLRSWIMDIALNPSLDWELTIDSQALVNEMCKEGFELWESWPSYSERSEMYWHRDIRSSEIENELIVNYLKKRTLAHFFGVDITLDQEELSSTLEKLLFYLNNYQWDLALHCVKELESYLSKIPLPKDKLIELTILTGMLSKIFTDASAGDKSALENLVKGQSTDSKYDFGKKFLNFWGQPNHFALFKRKALV